MPNNKNAKQETDNVAPVDELTQLRQIVFGVAEQELSQQIATTHASLEQALKQQQLDFNERLAKMQDNIVQQIDKLEQKLLHVDKSHEQTEAIMQKDPADLSSEHEMFATTTQQDFKQIEQALDHESQTLSQTFNQQLEQLKTHLDAVSKELSSSKTDRKTLAKLLATMATNLEDDAI
ncbi:hypothetical protein SAMN05216262_12112 [Colwellia chukchiensis]|uniref:Uncharacterized protein n=1 Tax=Colwellia chukchiensis TaxID=641665 RepID=A0A1H7SVI5_9GAMM|nr:hypothetical protein [Colwellia chukchiensis]SEL76319.1 hypothetical protein SAMN05216262_12112 [Colwellia chukchiensis]